MRYPSYISDILHTNAVSNLQLRYPRYSSDILGTNARIQAESYPTSENIQVTNPTYLHPG